ncbi:hypothetical protein J27TS8_24320 [Robertmurraya siralis]|uniref:Uncharacterized protein n=1 Tax=Robertmurraya siralis TaxID=77777 RepID=A0A919WIM3_9BACI|nr:hypothetical protein [Robertmurraya siralis]PAE20412.1 hypothetical protein CHH80_11420 [Bacillus sp. 7504-2]GIN62439.1 hypothetical protein J27TS8_24320 [Robertmurraya siralis]
MLSVESRVYKTGKEECKEWSIEQLLERIKIPARQTIICLLLEADFIVCAPLLECVMSGASNKLLV